MQAKLALQAASITCCCYQKPSNSSTRLSLTQRSGQTPRFAQTRLVPLHFAAGIRIDAGRRFFTAGIDQRPTFRPAFDFDTGDEGTSDCIRSFGLVVMNALNSV